MSPSSSKCVEVNLKKCNTKGKLTETGMKKKLYPYERLRKTRMYTAFLAEAFTVRDSGALKECEKTSIQEWSSSGIAPSVPKSSSSRRVDCDEKGEQLLLTKLQKNKHWNAANTTLHSNVGNDNSISKGNCSLDRSGTVPVLHTCSKSKKYLNGISNSESLSVSSKSRSEVKFGNKLKPHNCAKLISNALTSTQKYLKHTGCCPTKVFRRMKRQLLSKKLNVNKVALSSSEHIPNGLYISQAGSWHSHDAVKKALKYLLETFGYSRHTLWQCQFCPYSGIPFRVEEHVALKHLAVTVNENNLFVCPHCDMEFASNFTSRLHLKTVHSQQGNRPCPHCHLIMPYRKLGSHISSHMYDDQLAAIKYSIASTKKQLHATTAASATKQLAAAGLSDTPVQSVMPALSATAQSEPTEQLKETLLLTASGKLIKRLAPISPSQTPPINPKTQAKPTVPVQSLENGPIIEKLEQPKQSKVNLGAVCIIYQSIEKEGLNHCPICMFSSRKPDLLNHLVEKHLTANSNQKGEIICPHCECICLTGEKYSIHLQTVHNSLYPCPLCSTVLPQPESLLNHLIHHVCQQITSLEKDNIGLLNRKWHRNQGPNQVDAKSLHNVFISAVLLKHKHGMLKCSLCYYYTKPNSTFKRHLSQVHLASVRNKSNKIKCHHCTKVFSHEKLYNSHLFKDHPINYPCPHCNLLFPAKHRLESHLQTHFQPFVQLEYLQIVSFGVPVSSASSVGCREEKLQDHTCCDPCCSRPLVTAELTRTADCSHHIHRHMTDIDTNRLGGGPSKDELYPCVNTLDRGLYKHKTCLCKTGTQPAEQLTNVPCASTEGHERPLMHVPCASTEGHKGPLMHVTCPLTEDYEGHELLAHVPCPLTEEKHEEPQRHVPCSCTEDSQPVDTEPHCGRSSNEVSICPLCNLTCEDLCHFSSHLRKAHQDARGWYYCSLCHHTEQNPSLFELHVFSHLNSDSETNTQGKEYCISSYCYNIDCKKEMEESEQDLFDCTVFCESACQREHRSSSS